MNKVTTLSSIINGNRFTDVNSDEDAECDETEGDEYEDTFGKQKLH